MSQATNGNQTLNIVGGTSNYAHTGESEFSIGTTTTSSTFLLQDTKTLENVEFIENEEGNFMEITYSLTPNYNITYTVSWTITPPAKRMIKERYGVVDGKMQLIKTIHGNETEGYYVPSSVEWEE